MFPGGLGAGRDFGRQEGKFRFSSREAATSEVGLQDEKLTVASWVSTCLLL